MSLTRIIFAGTPEYALPSLRALVQAKENVVGVYTQPDRRKGRGKRVLMSPIKEYALQHNIEVFQPENFKSSATKAQLSRLKPDLMVVIAYGLILPSKILAIPRLGCVNLHASLLPRWRGAAPIQRCLQAGDTGTGVCLMQMEKGLDTGPILARHKYTILPDETGGSLHDRLAFLSASLLMDNLSAIIGQSLPRIKQPDEGISYASKLSKDETHVNWRQGALKIRHQIHAFNPWPVMASTLNEVPLRFYRAEVLAEDMLDSMRAGQICQISKQGIVINTGNGQLRITKLQKPGGKILVAKDFLNGFSCKIGDCFE